MGRGIYLLSLAFILGACKGKKTYILAIPPAHEEQVKFENVHPLEEALERELNAEVNIYIAEDYGDLEKKASAGIFDIAFLPPKVFVSVEDKYEPILKIVRKGKGFYRGIILTTNEFQKLEELEGHNWAYPDRNSTSGYLLPLLYFRKHNIEPKDFFNYEYEAGGHDLAVELLYRGNVQIATVFDDARELVKKRYPDIYEKTRVLDYTDSVPNDPVVVKANLSPSEKESIKRAILKISKDEKYRKVFLSMFGAEGFTEATKEEYSIVKELNKLTGR